MTTILAACTIKLAEAQKFVQDSKKKVNRKAMIKK